MQLRKNSKRIVLWIALVVTLAFIWGNSLLSVEASGAISNHLKDDVTSLVQSITHTPETPPPFLFGSIRKTAHFAEFFLLGAELFLLWSTRKRSLVNRIFLGLSCGLWVAVTDEALQQISGRNASVRDILLDLAGVLGGILLALLGLWLWRTVCRRHGQAKDRKGE